MSVVLNGSSQYLYLGNDIQNGMGPTTVVGWGKSTNDDTIQCLFGLSDKSATTDFYRLGRRGTVANDPAGVYVRHDSDIADLTTSTTTVNTWHHYALVCAADNDWRLYIDGSNKVTDGTNVIPDPLTLDETAIGALPYNGSFANYWSGKISKVAFWTTALNDTQIAYLAAGVSPASIEAGSLKAYWKCYDDATDEQGNYDLTEAGSPTYDISDEPSGVSTAISDKVYSKKLIAVGNNELWYESTAGTTMSELSAANGAINTLAPITAAEAYQKLFIANGTNLKVLDFVNTKITTTNVGSNPPDFGTTLTGGTSGATMTVDYITALSSTCTIYGKRTSTEAFQSGETVTGTDDDGNSISFTTSAAETAPPHWYNWTVFGQSSTFGTMPSQAYLVCLYRGRLVLAGNLNDPHLWYMTKVGNPFNRNFDSSIDITAVDGTNAVAAGRVGDIIRAQIPYGNDYLVWGCANSIYLLTGDPATMGGSIDKLSETTGIFSWTSWCKDDSDNLYFWGLNGFYIIPSGVKPPVNLSEGLLPTLVGDWAIDPDSHRVVLSYDPIRHGVIISKTTLSDGTNLNYFYDIRLKGFYPETYPEECGIFSSTIYDADTPAIKGLIVGCNDGYIRRFDETAKDDDIGATDEAISSYLTLEMIDMNPETEDSEGKLKSLVIELGGGGSSGDFSDSDGMSYEIHVADDAETCLEKIKDGDTAQASGTVTGPGRQNRIRVRARGKFLGIKLYNSTAAQTFVINSISGIFSSAGKI